MTTKLVSANLGLRLTLEVDGKQKDVEFSAVCPSESSPNLVVLVGELLDLLNDEFGTAYVAYDSDTIPAEIEIAKPKKIKTPKKISQAEFNRKIKELVP